LQPWQRPAALAGECESAVTEKVRWSPNNMGSAIRGGGAGGGIFADAGSRGKSRQQKCM
jgi:hypothetical protein